LAREDWVDVDTPGHTPSDWTVNAAAMNALGSDVNGKQSLLPSQAGHGGQVLSTDGSAMTWASALMTSAAPELIRDTMGTSLQAGANITITPNDAGDTITIEAPGAGIVDAASVAAAGALMTSAAPEVIRDTMGTALIAGSNVTVSPSDAGDTITISAVGGSGATNLSTTQTPTVVVVESDTGSDVALPAATSTAAGVMTSAMQNKLAGIQLLADVTGPANVAAAGAVMTSNLTELVQDIVANMLVAGPGVSLPYSDVSGTLQIVITSSSGSGAAIPAALPAALV
jgi:hypothetical protein